MKSKKALVIVLAILAAAAAVFCAVRFSDKADETMTEPTHSEETTRETTTVTEVVNEEEKNNKSYESLSFPVGTDWKTAYNEWMDIAVRTVDYLTPESTEYAYIYADGHEDVPLLMMNDGGVFYLYNYKDGKIEWFDEFVMGSLSMPVYQKGNTLYIFGSSMVQNFLDEITIEKEGTTLRENVQAYYRSAVDPDSEDAFFGFDGNKITEEEYDKIVAEIESYEQIEFRQYKAE
ncbi:MAG: hypothetical protein IJB86_10030 [Clostridia bacterium]|nr:hypothetical protein [Clostridia bacterium]